GTRQQVTVDLTASQRDRLPVGEEVEVVLPDGRTLPATVESVSTTVQSGDQQGDSGTTTVRVTLALAEPVPDYIEAPVEVVVTTAEASDALAVPVSALLALAEGGYAVEVVDATGATRLVGVELGTFADGLVEVRGDVAEGDRVVVPS